MRLDYIDAPFLPYGSGLPRSEGIHLTDIITSIERAVFNPRKNKWDNLDLTNASGYAPLLTTEKNAFRCL